jgi:hypothetical protein
MLMMMPAQRELDFAHGCHAFRMRLTFPENHEALPADTASDFGISICAFAEDLHLSTRLFLPGIAQHEVKDSEVYPSVKIPRGGQTYCLLR